MPEKTSSAFEPDQSQNFLVLPDASKLEALAEFAAGAGHEINNPLATIIGRAQLLLKDEQDPQRRHMLMSIGSQAYRIRDMIGDTMLFGRPPRPEFQNLNLRDVLTNVLSKLAAELENDGTTVRVQIPKTLILRADPTQLSIVLSELIRNSRHALQPRGGEIQISACLLAESSDHVILDVIDQGKGFTEIEREHAFDPFFSGRQAGRGLGFGLSKCWRIIDQHEGKIEIQSSSTGPTTVRVTWPIGS
jgi:signal transduction histidine kinase